MKLKQAIELLQRVDKRLEEGNKSYMRDDVISVTVEYGDYMQLVLRDINLTKERSKDHEG
jgi:hypothetical protein